MSWTTALSHRVIFHNSTSTAAIAYGDGWLVPLRARTWVYGTDALPRPIALEMMPGFFYALLDVFFSRGRTHLLPPFRNKTELKRRVDERTR